MFYLFYVLSRHDRLALSFDGEHCSCIYWHNSGSNNHHTDNIWQCSISTRLEMFPFFQETKKQFGLTTKNKLFANIKHLLSPFNCVSFLREKRKELYSCADAFFSNFNFSFVFFFNKNKKKDLLRHSLWKLVFLYWLFFSIFLSRISMRIS